jgi:hypothetical protein
MAPRHVVKGVTVSDASLESILPVRFAER